MSKTGMGVMIQMLGGNAETVDALEQTIGKTIAGMSMENNSLRIAMADGRTLMLDDGGQSCCEHRYMTCDDDLSGYEGATLVNVETRDAPSVEDEYGNEHEVQFLVVTTSKGTITAATHNEHNGYYGGFWIQARLSGETAQ